jgi:prepilin-type N-terminal cleavage/methylation domain-containing protein
MSQTQRGFTLLEMLVVVFIVGIVAAIAAPSWLSFVEKSQLTVANDKLYLGLRKAQSEAQHKRTVWQFSVRERDGAVEWATHPNSVTPAVAQWEALDSKSIQLDAESTFTSSAGVYYVRFDEGGNPHHLGRVTLSGKHFSMNKRCVIISTLIGAARKSQEQPTPDPTYTTRDRFCY